MGHAALKSIDPEEVQLAWGIYRALLMAEREDPTLADSSAHLARIAVARFRFERMYAEWCAQ